MSPLLSLLLTEIWVYRGCATARDCHQNADG